LVCSYFSMGITIHLYILKGALTIVSSISLGWTWIWKNEFIILIFPKFFSQPISARIVLIYGKGVWSLTILVLSLQ